MALGTEAKVEPCAVLAHSLPSAPCSLAAGHSQSLILMDQLRLHYESYRARCRPNGITDLHSSTGPSLVSFMLALTLVGRAELSDVLDHLLEHHVFFPNRSSNN